ncbi:T9SS type A sorting domain-containing protein [Hymenobacter sp. UYCo722]|uniref:T9SS type A sorting domain-containing protein n=1 Tax=Hymenobacter sp. UYCo722 TaxID=3156335 RepID=UPI003394FF0D
MTKKLQRIISRGLMVCSLVALFAKPSAAQAPLYSAVAVSDAGTGNNIGQANTSRNVAVDNTGAIYVVFSGSTGIRVAKSTTRGQSYSASVLITTQNSEAEIHAASNGTIYVAWSNGTTVGFSYSTTAGASFSAPVTLGSGGPAHISSFGSNVYVLPQGGSVLFRNGSNGMGAFSTTTMSRSYVYADVFAHPQTGDVYVVADDPTLYLLKSTNAGASFASVAINPATALIYYSSYTLSVGPMGSFIFGGGNSDNGNTGYKINVANGTAPSIVLANNSDAQGRTLVSDEFGNFVDGYYNGGSVGFRVSYNQGNTFQPAVTVATATSQNLARNPSFQDVVSVYTTPSGVFSTVYGNILPGANDLVISTPQNVPQGVYNNITVTGTGVATLTGAVQINNALTVASGGVLNTNCLALTGPGTFSLAAGATLSICDAAGITASGATGAVQTLGGRTFSNDATYIYNGTAAQATGNGLPTQVRNLTTTNANALILTAPTSVTQVLAVGGTGNMVLGSQALTLLSSAAGTALVVNSSTGVVSGNTATVQRYISSANTGLGYRHYSAPVSGSTVADLATAGFTPQTSQGDTYNASAMPGTVMPFPTVFAYDQARVALTNAFTPFDRGFVVPSASNPQIDLNLAVGRGYAVNIAGTELVDFVGTLNTGNRTLTLARNAAGSVNESEAGWHLVGNPYPAPIDYSLVAPANTNLENAMYVFESADQYTGTYRNYVNGIPATNRFVASSQGFFVRVMTGQTSGTLNFQNNQRVTDPTTQVPFSRGTADSRSLVQLDLRGTTGTADAFYAYAETGASSAFDAAFDARKLPNSTGLNLASVASTGETLSIDGRSVFNAATVLTLNVGVPAAGTYTFAAVALNNMPAGLDAFLSDAQTGQTVNLRTQPSYIFSVTATQATALLVGRFALRFTASALATAPALTAAQVELYPNPVHARFAVLMPGVSGASTVQAELVNSLGQVVRRQSAALPASGATLTVETGELAAGVYTLRLLAGPTTLTKRVVIQ